MRWRFLKRRHTKTHSRKNGKKSKKINETVELSSDLAPDSKYGANEPAVNVFNIEETVRDHKIDINENRNNSGAGCCDNTVHFRDGRRKIDYVLVYEETSSVNNSAFDNYAFQNDETAWRCCSQNGANSSNNIKQTRKLEIRQTFLNNLKEQGLDIEEEIAQGKRTVRFVKVHAPWSVLCHYAEELACRAPIKFQEKSREENWSEAILRKLRVRNVLKEELPHQPKLYATCQFRKSKVERLVDGNDRDSYFSSAERSAIVNEILSVTFYGSRSKGEVGIGRLLKEGVFRAAYPLHEGPYERKKHDSSELNSRQVLYQHWACWSKWYKYQPLDSVREYFGEKIAIYFAWLGFYTGWLIPVSVIGVLVFCYGLLTVQRDKVSDEVCNSRGRYHMCPLCDENSGCSYWDLSDICTYSKLGYLFDHPGTVAFAIFVSFWAVTFLEYWKRHSVSLAHRWDSLDFEHEELRPRPEFALKAPSIEKNPVTGNPEPAFPRSIRQRRILAGICFVFLMVCLVVVFIIAVIIYRIVVSIPLFQNETFRSQAQVIANLSGAVVNLILIMALGRLYEKIAYKITSWEMHRTQTEFDDNLTFKVFAFQFVNLYASIFYIAFFKGRFVGFPGNYNYILGLRNEDCNAGGCLVELAQQLAIIMIGKQIINNAQEIIVPKLLSWWKKKKVCFTQPESNRWEEDYQLVENAGLFEEYLEMVMQFGFITIFVAAFPLAPLFALLNNVVEIRLDAKKFVCDNRRPVAERAKDIGIWFAILDVLAHLAVISNAFLIAFTSDFLPRIVYQYEYSWSLEGYVNFTLAVSPQGTMNETCYYRGFRDPQGHFTGFFWKLLAVRLTFVILFEHVVFGICRLIDIMVPDIPQSLEIKMKRERYLAKLAFQDPESLIKVTSDGHNEAEYPETEPQNPEN